MNERGMWKRRERIGLGDWKGGNGTCVRMLITTKTEIWKCSFLSPFHFERYLFLYFPSSSNFLFRAFLSRSLSLSYTHSQNNHSKGFSSLPLFLYSSLNQIEMLSGPVFKQRRYNPRMSLWLMNASIWQDSRATSRVLTVKKKDEKKVRTKKRRSSFWVKQVICHLIVWSTASGPINFPSVSFLPIQVLPSRSVQLILHPMDLSVELVSKQSSVNPASFTVMKDSVLMDHPFWPVNQVDGINHRVQFADRDQNVNHWKILYLKLRKVNYVTENKWSYPVPKKELFVPFFVPFLYLVSSSWLQAKRALLIHYLCLQLSLESSSGYFSILCPLLYLLVQKHLRHSSTQKLDVKLIMSLFNQVNHLPSLLQEH